MATETVKTDFAEQESDVLIGVYRINRNVAEPVATLDQLAIELQKPKNQISKIISLVRDRCPKDEDYILRRTRVIGKGKGYVLNHNFLVTSPLTAALYLELKRLTSESSGSIRLARFREHILSTLFHGQTKASEEVFDSRITWGLNPRIHYLEASAALPDYIRESQRVHDEGFYLGKLAKQLET